MGEVWDKRLSTLPGQGQSPPGMYANQEAIAFYTQALSGASGSRLPVGGTSFSVYEGRGRVWFLLTKYDEAIADFQRMRQMARDSGQPRQGESLCHLARAHYGGSEGDLRHAEQYAQEAQQLAQRLGDANILLAVTSPALV